MENVNQVIGAIPMRYDITTDQLIPVTQEWVNEIQKSIQDLGFSFSKIREIVKMHPKDIRKIQL